MKKFSFFLGIQLLAILGTLPLLASTAKNIEASTGWKTCNSCAGINGTGPSAPHSMTQHISSPSLNSNATNYFLGGSTPYSDVIWWKDLGGSSASNFTYQVYFYVKNPSASQALEFDVNDSINNQWYVFGTECNYRQTKTWRVWDTKDAKWISTSIACAPPKAYAWNHLTIEMQRVNGKASFVSVTLNGSKHYINHSYYPKSNPGGYQTSVAFQMDGNYQQADYSVWLNELNLNYW